MDYRVTKSPILGRDLEASRVKTQQFLMMVPYIQVKVYTHGGRH